MTETATEWSLRTWRERLEQGYFENSVQHANWRICEKLPDWFDRLARPTRDDAVLEIGAGYGEWMIPLSPFVQTIAGVDIHEMLPPIATEKFREHGVENASFVCGDGTTLSFPPDTFTLIYSISVFQHLPREIVHGYLRETARVLTPDGRAVHMLRSSQHTAGGASQPVNEILAGHTGDFSCGWTIEQVREAAEAAGLTAEVHDIGLYLILLGTRR